LADLPDEVKDLRRHVSALIDTAEHNRRQSSSSFEVSMLTDMSTEETADWSSIASQTLARTPVPSSEGQYPSEQGSTLDDHLSTLKVTDIEGSSGSHGEASSEGGQGMAIDQPGSASQPPPPSAHLLPPPPPSAPPPPPPSALPHPPPTLPPALPQGGVIVGDNSGGSVTGPILPPPPPLAPTELNERMDRIE
jgi:hypothetical protein